MRAQRWWLGWSVLILASLVGVLVVRYRLAAKRELERANLASIRHDELRARRHLRRAAAYYTPGNTAAERAIDGLRSLAQRQEREGRVADALSTWHTLRAAILGLRGSTRPFNALLPAINTRIAALTAHQPVASPALRGDAGREALHARLAAPPPPRETWVFVALLGFVVALAASAACLRFGLTPDLRLIRRRFVPLTLLAGCGLLLFGLGLACA